MHNKQINPDSKYVHIYGRYIDENPEAVNFSYPGVTLHLEVDAQKVEIVLNDSTYEDNEGQDQHNRCLILIDGKEHQTLTLKEGEHTYTIAENLEDGVHKIEVIKLTEARVGDITFKGFDITDLKEIAIPAFPERVIEFIGNSITCGYGIESTNENEPFSYKTENAYKAFAMQTARNLSAQAELVSFSGKGITRNWGDTVLFQETMLELYDRCLPEQLEPQWDCARYTPQAVVINLGTNDFSPPLGAEKESFIKRYHLLLNKIRKNYGPYVQIFCLNGPLLQTSYRKKVETWLNECIDSRKDTLIHYFALSECTLEDGWGAQYHPSQVTANRNTKELTAFMRETLEWE